MENLYEKYDGMLMTFADDMTEEQLMAAVKSGDAPERRKYERETFERFLKKAENVMFVDVTHARRRTDEGTPQAFTPENMIVYKNELYAVRYCQKTNFGGRYYIVPLHKMSSGACLVDSYTYRFDDYGDHDSWDIDTFIEMRVNYE